MTAPLPTTTASTPSFANSAQAPLWRRLLWRREAFLLLLLVGVCLYGIASSPYFWDANNLLDDTSNFMEIGLLSLTMTLIIIGGHIDLSVASNAALSAVVFATRFQAGWNVWLAALTAILVGTLAGLLNGVIITRVRLPSLVVTLGTYALYRGVASGLLGNTEISGFPTSFAGIDLRYLPATHIPGPLVIFVLVAVLVGFILHATAFGRYIYAMGNNEQASRFAGVAVDRVVLVLFTASGTVAALAGLVLASRQGAVNYTLGNGFELTAITAAVLGGANIFGGEGGIPGTILGLFIIGMLESILTLINVDGSTQTIAIGVLLIGSILLPTLLRPLRAARRPAKGGERASG